MTDVAVPKSRPQLTADGARELLRSAAAGFGREIDLTKPALLGRRGYYRDTMGEPGVNDWGIYDDAIFYVSPSAFASFNANTDPSRHHPDVAQLVNGIWRFRIGIHNQSKDSVLHPHYKALVQAQEFVVRRDGTETIPVGTVDSNLGVCVAPGLWRGTFGINLHKGGFASTSSEGCQTIYPSQWDAFIGLADGDMNRHEQLSIPYALTAQT